MRRPFLEMIRHYPAHKAACRLYTRQNADFLNEALWPQHLA